VDRPCRAADNPEQEERTPALKSQGGTMATEAASVQGPGAQYVPRSVIVALFVVTTLVSMLVLYSLWAFWPEAVAGGKVDPSQAVTWFGWHLTPARETLFFLVVALSGALGGLIHTIRSLSWYVGNRDFRWSWVPFNLMLPIVGALGGTVFYLVLRAGLFSPSTTASNASPFGFSAVAVLVGLFSEQAMEKLRQVASNFFADSPAGQDHVDPGSPSSGGTAGS
jgi:hypothetical protein